MKDKELSIKVKEKTELNIQQQKQQQSELVGQIIPHNNHKVFEINKETLEISEAEYDTSVIPVFGRPETFVPRIIVKEGCVYIPAMNKENALKKHIKGDSGNRYSKEGKLKLQI